MSTATTLKFTELRAQWHELMAQAADVLVERNKLTATEFGFPVSKAHDLDAKRNAEHHRRMAANARKEAEALKALQ